MLFNAIAFFYVNWRNKIYVVRLLAFIPDSFWYFAIKVD